MATALPLVMIWRRVDSLHRAAVTTERVLDMPLIGKDEYSIMYDGGGVILGLWTQDERVMLATNQCSELNFIRYALISNPTSELVYGTPDLPQSLVRLSTASSVYFTTPLQRSDGTVVSVYDDGGNLSTFLEPSASRLRSKAGAKLTNLLNIRGLRRRTNNGTPAGIIGHKLLSGDLKRTVTFYTRVLGLEALSRTQRSVDFDAGNVLLTVEQEPAAGLVRNVARTGRLQGDWLVFLVKDINRSTEEIGKRGARFAQGVETSDIGQMAYFEDPDGHALVLWQPSGKPTEAQPIDFYPALQRIERELG